MNSLDKSMSHKMEKKEGIKQWNVLSNHKAENPKRITDWRQSKFKIFEPTVKPKNKRLEGGGRKPLELQLENGLVEWIYDSRSNGLRVSRKLFMAKVKYFYKSEWMKVRNVFLWRTI